MILNKTSSFLFTLIATVVILIYAQNLLTPLVFALLLWFLVRKIKQVLDKIPFIKNKFPSWIKSLLTSVFIFSILGFLSKTLTSNISNLTSSYVKYESNIQSITTRINKTFNINLIEIINVHATDLNFEDLLSSVLNSISFILSNAIIILLYTTFILLEERYFNTKLKAIFKGQNKHEKITSILEKIEKSISDYIGLKTLVSLFSASLSYIVFILIGIDSPVFWSILIFLLNYIPTIGPLIGVLFPAFFALIQFGDFNPCLKILVFVGLIQFIIGNILEPKVMGNSLNISSLVTIIALSFWGAIWGITGMILCVPITVIIVIVCSQFERTKPIAILLSEKGEI